MADLEALLQLRKLFESNRIFMTLAQEINAPIMNTFLGVALWGEDARPDDPLSIHELSERVGLAETTVSRHLRYLGIQRRIGVEGLGLVDTKLHPLDRRQKIVFLTRAGKTLRDQLMYAMGEGRSYDNQTATRSMAG